MLRAETCAMQAEYNSVINSDLLYERGATTALAEFIACHVSPSGELWIIDPDRGNRRCSIGKWWPRAF